MGDPVMRLLVLLSTAFNIAFTGPIVVGLPWLVQFRFGEMRHSWACSSPRLAAGRWLASCSPVWRPEPVGWVVC